MAYCKNCGSPVEGQFCGSCGAAVAGSSSGPQYAAPQAQPGGQAAQPAAAGGLTVNVASALCYVLGFITGILFLVLAPYNQNKAVRFHAFQSIFLSVGAFLVGIALSIVSTIFFAISFWLGSLFGLVHLVFGLGLFGVWLYMLWKTYQNEKVVLPVIGPLAEKQA